MNKSLALTILGAGILVVPAHATLMYSWEDGLDGWNSQTSGAVTLTQVTTNATDGTHALEMTYNGGFHWVGITASDTAQIPAFNSASTILIDVTLVGAAPAWANSLLFINGPTTGWNQTAVNTDFILDGHTHTVSYDISALPKPLVADGWFQIGIAVNGPTGAPITLDFDNMRTAPVPEPASMTALGLGALALIRRRKSK